MSGSMAVKTVHRALRTPSACTSTLLTPSPHTLLTLKEHFVQMAHLPAL